jgi:hypothetical protein
LLIDGVAAARGHAEGGQGRLGGTQGEMNGLGREKGKKDQIDFELMVLIFLIRLNLILGRYIGVYTRCRKK